jgi:hypothetical protein
MLAVTRKPLATKKMSTAIPLGLIPISATRGSASVAPVEREKL